MSDPVVVREVKCCAERHTNCPVVRLRSDGMVELEDENGWAVELGTADEARRVAHGILEVLGGPARPA